jgi:hypothetical protein
MIVANLWRIAMFGFKRDKREARRPETHRLTEAVVAEIWSANRDGGGKRIDVSFSRFSGKERNYRTFHPIHLLELTEAIGIVAGSLSDSQYLDVVVRDSLRQLAKGIEATSKMLEQSSPKVNGTAAEEVDGVILKL